MSKYVKEVLGMKVNPRLMQEAIEEVLVKELGATITDKGYKIPGWYGSIQYQIDCGVLTYTVDFWQKVEEWHKIKKRIKVNYTARVYQTAAMKAGWKNVSKQKVGDKIKIYAR